MKRHRGKVGDDAAMTGKTKKLEGAIRKQAASLDPAQREFVLAEFDTYQWNASRIEALEATLKSMESDEVRDLDREGKLFRQRHQLVAEQSSLFSHIMRWLKGTTAGESELEAFLNG